MTIDMKMLFHSNNWYGNLIVANTQYSVHLKTELNISEKIIVLHCDGRFI